jgi:hypothetical protein
MLEGKSQAEEVFSEAWQQVAAGRSIESVLADYPDCAAELEPMLRLTGRVRTLSDLQPSAEALDRIRLHAFGHSQAPGRVVPAPRGTRTQVRRLAVLFSPVRISVGALLLLLVGAMLTSAAFVLAVSKLSSPVDNSSAMVAYGGTITRMEGTVWQVDDSQVIVDDSTQIHGQPVVGATMHCIAQPVSDNELKAIEIWVRSAPTTPTAGPGGPGGPSSPAPDAALAPPRAP